MDVTYHLIWNEKSKGLKIKVPTTSASDYFAQMAFGIESYTANGYEYPCNRYVGVRHGDGKALTIYNNCGVHSVSKDGADLYLTLLNGSAYCAHPIETRPLITRPDIFCPPVEQGVHDFSFRVQVNYMDACEKISNEWNQAPYALSYFPHGDGDTAERTIVLSNTNIVISACKRKLNGQYLIRLYNGSAQPTTTELTIKGIPTTVSFKPFEFVTLIFDGSEIQKAAFADEY